MDSRLDIHVRLSIIKIHHRLPVNVWELDLGKAEGQIAAVAGFSARLESGTQFVHEPISMALLADVLQQVAHDLLEALRLQPGLSAQTRQNVRQQVVHRVGSLHTASTVNPLTHPLVSVQYTP